MKNTIKNISTEDITINYSIQHAGSGQYYIVADCTVWISSHSTRRKSLKMYTTDSIFYDEIQEMKYESSSDEIQARFSEYVDDYFIDSITRWIAEVNEEIDEMNED